MLNDQSSECSPSKMELTELVVGQSNGITKNFIREFVEVTFSPAKIGNLNSLATSLNTGCTLTLHDE